MIELKLKWLVLKFRVWGFIISDQNKVSFNYDWEHGIASKPSLITKEIIMFDLGYFSCLVPIVWDRFRRNLSLSC